MNNILIKLIKEQPVTKEDLYEALYEMCDNVHASCNGECLIYQLHDYTVPDTANDFEVNRGCDYFKNGKKMYNFLRNYK